jgi:hypothetical protein
MLFCGRDFCTPKQSDTKAWKAAQILLEYGLRYESGCDDRSSGYRPSDPAEAQKYIEEWETRYPGWGRSAKGTRAIATKADDQA